MTLLGRKSRLICTLTYQAVMDIIGFIDENFTATLGYLVDNKAYGTSVVGMHEPQKILWLRTFLAK
jgi:hypothetical protein